MSRIQQPKTTRKDKLMMRNWTVESHFFALITGLLKYDPGAGYIGGQKTPFTGYLPPLDNLARKSKEPLKARSGGTGRGRLCLRRFDALDHGGPSNKCTFKVHQFLVGPVKITTAPARSIALISQQQQKLHKQASSLAFLEPPHLITSTRVHEIHAG